MATTKENGQEQINRGRIWWVGLLAIGASVIANLLLQTMLYALFDLPADFPPMQTGAIVFFTVLYTFLGVVVFAIVARFARQPVITYRLVAAVALILSLIPNLFLARNPDAGPFPGGDEQAFMALLVFHLVSFIIVVGMLTTMTVENGRDQAVKSDNEANS